MPIWLWHTTGYVIALAAIMLLAWSILGDRSRGRRRCRRCWYDLASAGATPLACPECGCNHTTERLLTRTRRRWGGMSIAALLLIVSYSTWTTPRVLDRGWRGAVPTTLLAPLAPWLPRAWQDHEVYRISEGQQHTDVMGFMQEIQNEMTRAASGTPETLAEELVYRWNDTPRILQRATNHVWDHAMGGDDRPWYHWHRVEPNFQIMSLPWHLRLDSLAIGALSPQQAHDTRALELARHSDPRPRIDPDTGSITFDALGVGLRCRSPEAHAFEAALLDTATGDVQSAVTGIYDHTNRAITGGPPLGPMPWGTPSATFRYTLLDAEGSIIDRHTVRYDIAFSTSLEKLRELPRRQQRLGPLFVNIVPAEMNGVAVRDPRRP